jgi:segregation and condensation protein B
MVELRTGPNAAELVERVQKEEYARDIGKAGLEALAAILYRGPLTRAEVDFIRGVNSTQTLRTLTMRGLVRKISNPKDERSFLYQPTTELYAELGIHSQSELPEYASTRAKLEQLESAYRAKEDETHAS